MSKTIKKHLAYGLSQMLSFDAIYMTLYNGIEKFTTDNSGATLHKS